MKVVSMVFVSLGSLLASVAMATPPIPKTITHSTCNIEYQTTDGTMLASVNLSILDRISKNGYAGVRPGRIGTAILPGVVYFQIVKLTQGQYVVALKILTSKGVSTFAQEANERTIAGGIPVCRKG